MTPVAGPSGNQLVCFENDSTVSPTPMVPRVRYDFSGKIVIVQKTFVVVVTLTNRLRRQVAQSRFHFITFIPINDPL